MEFPNIIIIIYYQISCHIVKIILNTSPSSECLNFSFMTKMNIKLKATKAENF